MTEAHAPRPARPPPPPASRVAAIDSPRRPGEAAADAVARPTIRCRSTPDPAADETGGQPIYLRVANQLKRAIADGTYPVGAHLPTELALCEQFGISRFTARGAVRAAVHRRPRDAAPACGHDRDRDARRRALPARRVLGARPAAVRAGHPAALVYVGKRRARPPTRRASSGRRLGQEWVYAVGIRVTDVPRSRARPPTAPAGARSASRGCT